MARVIVYKNLNRGDWSIAQTAGRDGTGRGKVIGHADSVILANVTMRVQEAGRLRVMAKRQREVHAWCIGDIVDSLPAGTVARELTYNPYRCGTFTLRDGTPLDHAAYVEFTTDKMAIAHD